MKKLFACVLALAMAAAMAAPALAEESATTTDRTANVTQEGNPTRIPVHATYKGPQDVVSVDIVWDAMDFTYISEDAGTWDPANHTYTPPTNTGWNWNKPEGASETQTAPKITLTNHSNIGVNAVFGFKTDIEGLEGTFSPEACSFARAKENTAYNAAPSDSTTFSLDGTGIDAEQDLGNITVTISKGEIYETLDRLQAAIVNAADGDTITLGADIIDTGDGTSNAPLHINQGQDIVLDLNGHTMSSKTSSSIIWNQGTLTIKNGTVIHSNEEPNKEYSVIINEGSLTADGLELKNEYGRAITARSNSTRTNVTHCTLYSGEHSTESTLVLQANARIADCSITNIGAEVNGEAICFVRDTPDDNIYTLTIGGDTTVEKYISAVSGCTYKIAVEDGCTFDPIEHLHKEYNITKTDDRTWTVTRESSSSQD